MQTKHLWLVMIGTNIRKLREAKGLTQEQLAELAGLDRTYIGGIERGERNTAAINLIRIAVALDVDVAFFFPPIAALRQAAETRPLSDKQEHGE